MLGNLNLRGRCVASAFLLIVWTGAAQSQDNKPAYLDQGWSAADRNMFYTTTQGSEMMPYDWFLALEQPDSNNLFLADGLARFGYLPNPDKTNNPDSLPVGFVKDSGENGDWVGMTCAACHTSQINFAGKTLQIDGGPTDADMWALISELGTALAQTSSSDDKFQRFADRVRHLSPAGTAQPDATLRKNLKDFSDNFTKYVASSKTNVAWGRARLDAFGMIFNRATGIDLDNWANTHPPNAPVSYPFLWDTHWHDKVQWNGSAPNQLAIEQLARNVGEVLGVFAQTDIKKTVLPPLFFTTTAKRANLMLIEQKLASLRSPAWPRELPPIDAKKAAAGQTLYTDLHCDRCHAITRRDQPLTFTTVQMVPVKDAGTDPTMAQNAANLQSDSGILEGVQMPFLLSAPLPARGPSFELTGKIVIGAILAPLDLATIPGELNATNKSILTSIKNGQPPTDGLQASLNRLNAKIGLGAQSNLWQSANAAFDKKVANTNSMAYKARPLDGIWATAPYLHNGSVPNLYQLLLPAKDRKPTFYVGTRDFDPVNVGFVIDKRDGAFQFDTSLPGNSNAGHDTYGTDTLTDVQRWQLIEYLKTL